MHRIYVVLANFYDAIIDTPNAQKYFLEMLTAFEGMHIISKEQKQKYLAHIDDMKKEIESEYTK